MIASFVNLSYRMNFNGVIIICIVQIIICIHDIKENIFLRYLISLLFLDKLSLLGSIVNSSFNHLISLFKTLNLSYIVILLSINSVRDFVIIFILYKLCVDEFIILFNISKAVNSNEIKATLTYNDTGKSPSIFI